MVAPRSVRIYRIVVAESRFARDGRFVERIGSYNPMLTKEDPNRVLIEIERAQALALEGRPADRARAAFLRQARPDGGAEAP